MILCGVFGSVLGLAHWWFVWVESLFLRVSPGLGFGIVWSFWFPVVWGGFPGVGVFGGFGWVSGGWGFRWFVVPGGLGGGLGVLGFRWFGVFRVLPSCS